MRSARSPRAGDCAKRRGRSRSQSAQDIWPGRLICARRRARLAVPASASGAQRRAVLVAKVTVSQVGCTPRPGAEPIGETPCGPWRQQLLAASLKAGPASAISGPAGMQAWAGTALALARGSAEFDARLVMAPVLAQRHARGAVRERERSAVERRLDDGAAAA